MSGGVIWVEVDGNTYSGWHVVSGWGSGRMVTVNRPPHSKTTQVGGSPPESIARMLLWELVRAEKSRVGHPLAGAC